MIVGDAANLLLGGIPGDLHDMFVMDVEPDDLLRASHTLQNMSTSVHDIHVKLSGNVSSLEGRWEGSGAATFDSEIWQPLSHGLGTLERECSTAAGKLASLAVQAEAAHAQKVEQLAQEIQTQLYIYAGTSLIGGPELGGVISDAVGALAGRLGGELVGRIVSGIIDAITDAIQKVLAAFGTLLKYAGRPLTGVMHDLGSKAVRVMESMRGDAVSASPVASGPISIDESSAGHIFRNVPGHLTDDTLANRALLTDTANDPANLVGTDQWGSTWYARMLPDGRQAWVRVRNGVIKSGGVNASPGTWNPATGMSGS